MEKKIRWGILSTGNISRQFARGLQSLADAELVAVGSRSEDKAVAFAKEHGAPRAYGSYEELAADPDIDAIYVSTPHPYHKENALTCIEAGKAVLCEKPFTMNAGEARELVDAARREKVFLMEAMWTRFIPAMARVREILKSGVIGELKMLQADFGFRAMFDPQSRIFAPSLGGGALLDVGVYVVSLASMVLGKPSRIAALAQMGQTGVDELSAMVLGYPGGQLSVLSSAVVANTPWEADLLATEGRLRIEAPFFKPEKLTIVKYGKGEETIQVPFEGNGYNYEACEVGDCLRAGKTESEIMPLDETIGIMETMDEIRAQWGLKYPME